MKTFPDGSCPSLKNCGKKRADLFEANGKRIAHFFGVAPGRNDTHLHSPASGSQKSVLASQGLGTFTWTFATPVTQLEFIDWPATIGIDNLKIDPAPEPSSVILLGTAIAAAFLAFLRKKGEQKNRLGGTRLEGGATCESTNPDTAAAPNPNSENIPPCASWLDFSLLPRPAAKTEIPPKWGGIPKKWEAQAGYASVSQCSPDRSLFCRSGGRSRSIGIRARRLPRGFHASAPSRHSETGLPFGQERSCPVV